MTGGAASCCAMDLILPATVEAIEEFFVEFRRRCRCMESDVDCFAVELLVREALTNAVIHGSNADPRKHVRCFLRFKRKRLLITVKDEGAGFDWRAPRESSDDIPGCSGRGIQILRKYANWVRFNERGNLVTMVKRF